MRPLPLLPALLLLSACASGMAEGVPSAPVPRHGPESSETAPVQSYGEVTKGLTAHPGVFTVHTSLDRLLYEIPRGELEKPFLMVSQIS